MYSYGSRTNNRLRLDDIYLRNMFKDIGFIVSTEFIFLRELFIGDNRFIYVSV